VKGLVTCDVHEGLNCARQDCCISDWLEAKLASNFGRREEILGTQALLVCLNLDRISPIVMDTQVRLRIYQNNGECFVIASFLVIDLEHQLKA
jgi:hypothetical protein